MAKQELLMEEKAIYEMHFHGSVGWWIREGDKTAKEFFRSKGPRHARTMLHNFSQEDGSTTEDGEEMRNIATT
mgnify:CR=1 FL=1